MGNMHLDPLGACTLLRNLLTCKMPTSFRGLFVTCDVPAHYSSCLFHGFFVALENRVCAFLWLSRGFSVAFSRRFCGPRFGQILRALALEKLSDSWIFVEDLDQGLF